MRLLGRAVYTHGAHWRFLTKKYFPSRTEDSVRNQYKRHFESKGGANGVSRPLQTSKRRSGKPYTKAEDEELVRLILKHGLDWGTVAANMNNPGKQSKQSLKSRWRRFILYGHKRHEDMQLTTSSDVLKFAELITESAVLKKKNGERG